MRPTTQATTRQTTRPTTRPTIRPTTRPTTLRTPLRAAVVRDSLPLLAGAAAGVGAVGAVLALADLASPVRAPFTLFFLLVAPAGALATVLRGLDPLSRVVLATGGGVVIDVLVAEGMLALHMWSARGGIAAVAAVSVLLVLLSLIRGEREEQPDSGR